MLIHSSDEIPRTVGYGAGGLIDRILHGSDSRHIEKEKHERMPNLQTCFYRAMIGKKVKVKLMSGEEVAGELSSLYQDGARLVLQTSEGMVMVCVRRVRYCIPQEDVQPVRAIEKNMQEMLLANAERG